MTARQRTPPTTPPAIAPVLLLCEEDLSVEDVDSAAFAAVEAEDVDAGRALVEVETVALGLTVVSLPSTIQTPLPSIQHVEPLVLIPQHRLPSSQTVSATLLLTTLLPKGSNPVQGSLRQPLQWLKAQRQRERTVVV